MNTEPTIILRVTPDQYEAIRAGLTMRANDISNRHGRRDPRTVAADAFLDTIDDMRHTRPEVVSVPRRADPSPILEVPTRDLRTPREQQADEADGVGEDLRNHGAGF